MIYLKTANLITSLKLKSISSHQNQNQTNRAIIKSIRNEPSLISSILSPRTLTSLMRATLIAIFGRESFKKFLSPSVLVLLLSKINNLHTVF